MHLTPAETEKLLLSVAGNFWMGAIASILIYYFPYGGIVLLSPVGGGVCFSHSTLWRSCVFTIKTISCRVKCNVQRYDNIECIALQRL